MTLTTVKGSVLNRGVNVKDYGAVGDGVTDDTAAIQAAVDTGLDVFFPQGRYIITSTITVNTRGQALYGTLSAPGKEDITSTDHGSVLEFSIDDAATDDMFLVTLSQVSFVNLKFIGDSGSTNDTAIRFQKDSNTDDVDSVVKECGFNNWKYGIYNTGRALTATGNTFSIVGDTSIYLDWDGSDDQGDLIQTDDLYKGRKFKISDNRFHGGVAISVINFILRGAIITGNVSDITTQFIHVLKGTTTSGMNGCVIDGNIMDLSIQEPIDFEEATVCINTVISNNRIGGSIADTIDGTSRRPYAGITFDGIDIIDGVIIAGNAIYGTDACGISLRNTPLTTPTTIRGLNITSNLFGQIGLDASANRAVVLNSYDITDYVFANNHCVNLDSTVVSILRSSSNTVTNYVFKNNLYDSSLPQITTTAIAGTQDDAITNSGTYTPSQVSTNTNVDSVTFSTMQYMRVGNTVTVSGNLSVDATAGSTNTVVKFSLPIASNFNSSTHLGGQGTENAAIGVPTTLIGLNADSTNDCVLMRFTSPGTANVAYTVQFTYLVL